MIPSLQLNRDLRLFDSPPQYRKVHTTCGTAVLHVRSIAQVHGIVQQGLHLLRMEVSKASSCRCGRRPPSIQDAAMGVSTQLPHARFNAHLAVPIRSHVHGLLLRPHHLHPATPASAQLLSGCASLETKLGAASSNMAFFQLLPSIRAAVSCCMLASPSPDQTPGNAVVCFGILVTDTLQRTCALG